MAAQTKEPPTREESKEAVAVKGEEKIPLKPAEQLPKEQVAKPQPEEEVKKPEEQVQAILDQRQHDFLIGKKVKKDLLADDGTLILKAGDTITEQVLEKAKAANKYLELGFYV